MKQLIQTLYFSIIKSMIGKYVTYAMQFISVIIFSRLFTPEEFGLFSVIFSIVVFFQVIAEGGVGPAIISLTEISNKTINSIFTLICTFAVVTSLILYCCTPLLSAFFHSPRINELSFLSVVMVFFYSASVFPVSFLQREKRFITISICEVASELIAMLVTLLIYYFASFDRVFVLTFKYLIYSSVRFFLLFFKLNTIEVGLPKLSFDIKNGYLTIIGFTRNQFIYNINNYLVRNVDNFLVGKFLGFDALGYYSRAYQLMTYPLMLLSYSIAPAIQPVMKNYKNDIETFNIAFKRITVSVFFISSVTSFIIANNANSITQLIFGSKWLFVSQLIEVLCLSIPFQIFTTIITAFIQASGKTNKLLKVGTISSLLFCFFISVGISIGEIKVVVILITISYIIINFSTYAIYAEMAAFTFCNAVKLYIQLLLIYVFVFVVSNAFMFAFPKNHIGLLASSFSSIVIFGTIYYFFEVNRKRLCHR